MKNYLFMVLILLSGIVSAQNKIEEWYQPQIVVGQNGVPITSTADSTRLFHGETMVTFLPREPVAPGTIPGFTTSGYTSVTAGTSYFRAYLGPVSYAVLQKVLDDYYYTSQDGKLYFRYDEKYLDAGYLKYKIYDYQRNVITTNVNLAVDYVGANFFSVDLKTNSTFTSRDFNLEHNKYYVIEVQNGKGEMWKLRFKYIPL
jgi:hypothetical protein